MAKRSVPDFDSAAAFDAALARAKPELAARLGGPLAVPVLETPQSAPMPEPKEEEVVGAIDRPRKSEPMLKVVVPQNDPPARSRRRGVVARASGQELRRLTVYVDLALAQRLREHCFEHELNLSDVAAEALRIGLGQLTKNDL
jgi:hypothetical protein